MPGYRPLNLDLYLPAKGHGAHPLVIFIHGGGWERGNSRNVGAFSQFPRLLGDLAARGYVVASVNYRLANEARAPSASTDVENAILWLKGHAAEYGIDKNRVALWGASAGGQLAALAAADCRATVPGKDSACVQSAVIWYGVFDFPKMSAAAWTQTDKPIGYLGCRLAECGEIARTESPINHVSPKSAPMLLIYGDEDKRVPPDQSRSMAAALKAAGVRAETIELPRIDHNFIGHTPEATHEASIKAMRATFAFFDKTIGKPGPTP